MANITKKLVVTKYLVKKFFFFFYISGKAPMDIIILILASLLMVAGVLGSFLPILPGIPLSWCGLLVFHLSKAVPMNYTFLGITLVITIIIFALLFGWQQEGDDRCNHRTCSGDFHSGALRSSFRSICRGLYWRNS